MLRTSILALVFLSFISSQGNGLLDSLKSVHEWGTEIELANQIRRDAIQARRNGNFQLSFDFLQIAKKLFEDNDDLAGSARVLNSLGLLFWHQNEVEKALEYYYKGVTINDSLGIEIELARNYLNIGNALSYRNSFQNALKYYSLSEDLTSKNLNGTRDSLQVAFISTCRGNIFADFDNPKKNYDSAIIMYNQALPIYQAIGRPEDLAGSFNNYGLVYEGLAKTDSSSNSLLHKALENYTRALDLRSEESSRMISYLNIGNVQRKLNKYNMAKLSYLNALAIAEKSKNQRDVMNIVENLILNNLSRSRNHEILKYFERYDQLKDTLYTELRAKQFEELQTKYETEKKDQQLKLNEATILIKTAESRTLMITLLVAIGFTIILIIIFQQRQKALKSLRQKEQELHAQEVNQMVHNQELKAINAMLEGEEKERKRIAEDLHDRVGSMLSAMKLQADPKNEHMNGLLDETVDEVRRISHNLETKVLNRFGLVAALEDLADKINKAEKVDFELQHLDLSERLENKVEINAYRIVQELVSNALKHSQASEITTQVNRIDNQIIITVEDNGVGFNSLEVKEQATGMGLKNVKSRAHELNGNFNVDSGKGHGTTVTIDFPI